MRSTRRTVWAGLLAWTSMSLAALASAQSQPPPSDPPGRPAQPSPSPAQPPPAEPVEAAPTPRTGPAEPAPKPPGPPPGEQASSEPGQGSAEAAAKPPAKPPLRRWAFGPEARFKFLTGEIKALSPTYGYGFAASLRFWIRPYFALQGVFSFDRFQRQQTVSVQTPQGLMSVDDTQRLDYSTFVITAVLDPPQTRLSRVRPQFFLGAGVFVAHFYTPLPLNPSDANAVAGGVRVGLGLIGEVAHRIELYLRFEYDILFGGDAKVNNLSIVSNMGSLALGFLYNF